MGLGKKFFSGILACGLIFGYASFAHATNGYDMIATGAKSLGMAGATIAQPQDASTILQNPAGISWLKGTTADVGGSIFVPQRSLNGENSNSNVYMVPAAGFAVNPEGCNCQTSNFTFGIGMYGVSGMGVDWSNPKLTGSGWLKKAYSNMQMMEMAIGGAYRVNGHLSIGLTPVFVYQALQMEYDWNIPKNSAYPSGQYKDVLDTAIAYGYGFNLGILYKINQYVQIGAVYKSPRWMEKLTWSVDPSDTHRLMIAPGANTVKMRLNMPQQIGVGINIRPIKPLHIEFDVRWINYHAVMNHVDTEGLNTGEPHNTWNFDWHDQWVYAVGVSYDLTNKVTARAGFNYAKNPIDSGSINNNIISPAIVQSHITCGLTYKVNKRFDVSGAYAYAFPEKVSHTNTGMDEDEFGPKTQIEMHQNTVAFELSYNF